MLNYLHTYNLKDFLHQLGSTNYKSPVISLYVNVGSGKTSLEPKVFTTVINSLMTEALKTQEAYLKTLNQSQEKSLKNDLEEIMAFLTNPALEPAESLIIFKSNNELNHVISLPMRVKNTCTLQAAAYTQPLEYILQTNKTVLIAEVTKVAATFSTYNLGHIEQIHHIVHELLADNVDKTDDKLQLHRLDHLHRHFKDAAEYIFKHFSQKKADYLVVIGHEQVTTKNFIEYLHTDVKQKIIGQEFFSPEELAQPTTISDIVKDALIDIQIATEHEKAEILAAATGEGRLTAGLEQVIQALNRGMIKSLYIDATFKNPGFVCKDDGNISLTNRACPLCGKTPVHVPNIIEEIMDVSQRSIKDIFVFEHAPEKMKPYNHAAAFVFSPSET